MAATPSKSEKRSARLLRRFIPAKIAFPHLPDVFPRAALLAKLDSASRHVRTLWVAGPPGAGKTTLIVNWISSRKLRCLWYRVDPGDNDLASFFHYLGLAVEQAATRYRRPMPKLTTEYLAGVETFARNFFREMMSRIKTPFALVLDNVQELGTEAPLFGVLRAGLEEFADHALAVLISRAHPPPAFARLALERRLHVIGWDDLRLSNEESIALVKFLRGPGIAPPGLDQLGVLHQQCDGWLAGLLLLMPGTNRPPAHHESFDAGVAQQLFDYFAAEVFDHREPAIKKFLMQTALFRSFTAEMSERLTGYAGGKLLLDQLVREHHFTERRAGREHAYEYHPLFRRFLLERAREPWNSIEWDQLRQNAADILESSGYDEDAISLYIESGAWDPATRLICRVAPKLAEQGRFLTIAAAIGKLPPDIVVREPWLLYWQGVSCPPHDLPAACRSYEKAYDLFVQRDIGTGAYLAWYGAVSSINFSLSDMRQLDVWFQKFTELRRLYPDYPSAEMEERIIVSHYGAVALYMPRHPEFDFWYDKAWALALRDDVEPEIRALAAGTLSAHQVWCGNFEEARKVGTILDTMGDIDRAPPLPRLLAKTAEARYAFLTGDFAGCLAQMRLGLELAKASGVHLWDAFLILQGVSACLHAGDLTQAKLLLEQVEPMLPRMRGMDRAIYFYLRAWKALLMKDLAGARHYQEQALGTATHVALRVVEAQTHLGMSLILHETGDPSGANRHLEEARRLGRDMKSALCEFACRLTDAQYALDGQDTGQGVGHLRAAMALGRQHNFYTFVWWRPEIMSRLCAAALLHGIEPDYVRAMIKKRGLRAETHAPGDWPFAIRIHTLGSFRVSVNDLPLRQRAQKKPLELLKTILALGAVEVREERVAEILWPAAEADDAAQSLASTLHRLRKLIGESAIERREGRLTLSAQHCWFDVWAMEQSVADAEKACANNQPSEAKIAADRVLELYKGAFLPADADLQGTAGRRERLRSKFLRCLERAAHCFMRADRHDDAIVCYRHALEVDPLAEVFYRSLMQAYVAKDRRAEALTTYERCRRILAEELGTRPSRETHVLYETLRRGEHYVCHPRERGDP